jgi:transcriptional regulator with XRE-family HTH domain
MPSGGRPSPNVGAVIKRIRLERGLSQEALSYRAKLDQSRLSKLERGVEKLTHLQAVRLSDAFEMAIEVLWESE